MSTISDVARRAGVSAMTVSRVIHNSGYVNQATRERVEKAIADLSYVPNALARSLRFKQTRTIALVLTDITNPFFTTVARGVEDTASEQGFSVIFCNTDESEEEEARYLNVLLQKQVDGLLLVPVSGSIESIRPFLERQIPLVMLDRRITGVQVDGVRCHSEQGAYQLACHLMGLGHRRIAMLNGPEAVSTTVERVGGYLRAITESGLQPMLQYGEFTQVSGEQMAREAMSVSPHPTALFAANNFIAIGAFHALREAGLRVPEDISLVAFDDLPEALILEPFLTVAAQPAYEMGKRAAELLLDRLVGEAPDSTQEVVLPTELIVRRSSGKVKAS